MGVTGDWDEVEEEEGGGEAEQYGAGATKHRFEARCAMNLPNDLVEEDIEDADDVDDQPAADHTPDQQEAADPPVVTVVAPAQAEEEEDDHESWTATATVNRRKRTMKEATLRGATWTNKTQAVRRVGRVGRALRALEQQQKPT